MDFQGGGHQTGPGSGDQPPHGRGFPPGRNPPQTVPPQANGNGYSPISGYRPPDYGQPDPRQPDPRQQGHGQPGPRQQGYGQQDHSQPDPRRPLFNQPDPRQPDYGQQNWFAPQAAAGGMGRSGAAAGGLGQSGAAQAPPQDYLEAGPPHRMGPRDRHDGAASRPMLRRPIVLGAGSAAVLAVGAVAGFLLFGRHHSTVIHPGTSLALPTSNPTANSPYFDTKLGKWQHIGSRKLDPAPLTVNQLYPPRFMPTGGSQYTRVAASVDKDCTLAVFGTDLQTALQSGKCTQIVRATYISGDAKMMGTIGVVNLTSASAAAQAGKTTGPDELIAPLSTSKGPTKNLLNGTGVVYAEVKGHYLILMYAEFTNLKSPKTDAQKQQLVDFAKGMFGGSANIGLSNRMITGKPLFSGGWKLHPPDPPPETAGLRGALG